MVFSLPDGNRLKIRDVVLEKMKRYRQDISGATEAGGILIGRIILDSSDLIIDDVSEPMPGDIRKRYRFKRSPKGHQEYFDCLWEESEGRCYYFGEWHTHPEPIPTPSSIDIKNWKRIMRLQQEVSSMFFIIVGIKSIRIWQGDRKTGRIILLKQREV